MARLSKIERMAPPIREEIGRLREAGHTIDQILAKLRELDVDVSRSALGEHVKSIDAIAQRIRESRGAAEAIVRAVGEGSAGRQAKLNIELMQGLMMQLLAGQDGQDVQIDAKEAKFISETLRNLASAAKVDLDRELVVRREERERAKAEAAESAGAAARSAGLSEETVNSIRADILGIAA